MENQPIPQKAFSMDAIEVAAMHPPHKNIAIAMVAACIAHYWRQGIELEAIILNRHMYGLYKDFVRKMLGEEAADKNEFYWHNIHVRHERIISGKPLTVEIKKPKAEA